MITKVFKLERGSLQYECGSLVICRSSIKELLGKCPGLLEMSLSIQVPSRKRGWRPVKPLWNLDYHLGVFVDGCVYPCTDKLAKFLIGKKVIKEGSPQGFWLRIRAARKIDSVKTCPRCKRQLF